MESDEEPGFISQWEEEVSQLYDSALAAPSKSRAGLLAVTDELAARILAEVGVDVAGFSHLIDVDALRHIHKQHGSNREITRGQVPIVKQDILCLRLIVTEPDTITFSEISRRGLTRIEVTKELQGHRFYCVLEVRRGRWRLMPVTLYKRRSR